MFLATKCEPRLAKLKLLRDIGFKHLELYTSREWITPEVIDRALSFPFEYVVHAPIDYFDESVVKFAREIGAKGINTHKTITDEQLYKMIVLAHKHDLFVTLENEGTAQKVPTFGSIINLQDWIKAKERFPGLKLCIDVEHAKIKEVYPEIFTFASDIKHIHLSGYINDEIGHERPVYENHEQTLEVIKLLKLIGYEGFVVCEHDVEFHTRAIWERTFNDYVALFEE